MGSQEPLAGSFMVSASINLWGSMSINFWLVIIGIIFVIVFLPRLLPLFTDWIRELLKKKSFRRTVLNSSTRSDQELIWELRGMEPDEFEQYIALIFTKLGYKAKRVGGSGDGGIDVVIEKDGIESYIQCKHYLKNAPSPHDVRDFYGAIVDKLKNGGKGYFVTTREFTPEAQEFVENRPIELVDMQNIIEYVRQEEGANDVV
jgi:HJR/Mrr/RecB family endonuclease